MQGQYSNIRIAGMASAVPSYVMDNMDYIDIFGKRRVVKQAKMTGVYRHHLSRRYQKISDLCMRAAEEMIGHLGWARKEIKILVFGTQTADYDLPSVSIDLSSRLGLEKDCMAFDINLGCSAYDLGIQTIAGMLQSQPDGARALLMVGDLACLSPDSKTSGLRTVWQKQNIMNIMMFGSGGSVIGIEKQPGNNFIFCNYSDGTGWDAILKYHWTATMMKGNCVFEYAINDVAENLMKFQNDLHLSEDSIDYYCFHQAQKLILDNIADVCELPKEKVLTSYEEYGNTSGASIPITMCHNRDKFLGKEKVNICSCGFGVGFSMGISFYQIDPDCILPIVQTDEHYDGHIKHNGALYSRKALLMNPNTEISKMVARQLDRVGCNMSLYGNRDTLEELKSQFFWKDCDLFAEDLEKAVENISSKYDAVIFDMGNYTEEKLQQQISFLRKREMLSDTCNVILMTSEEKSESLLRNFMQSISEQCGCRVNAVAYVPESFDLFPDIGDSTEWMERQIRTSDPQKMSRPFFLANAIISMVSSEFAAISQSVIHISDTVVHFG